MPPITKKVPRPTRVDDIATSHGTARAHFFAVPHGVPRASLVLGHGSAGIASPDLLTLADGLPSFGIEVILVEQPWKVAGSATAPQHEVVDAVWVEVVSALRRGGVGLRRLAVGGRSSGARIACRTVGHTKPSAVLCLAYPLLPSREGIADRGAELALAAAAAPTTVVQGTHDRFGGPPQIALAVAAHGQPVISVAIPFIDHSFNLKANATITDFEARLIVVEASRRAVLRTSGNSGPLLER